MIITINSLTKKGKEALQKYFPQTKWFEIKCKINNAQITREQTKEEIKITIQKKFANNTKDKTFVIYLIQDMKKDTGIENMTDYNIEVKF